MCIFFFGIHTEESLETFNLGQTYKIVIDEKNHEPSQLLIHVFSREAKHNYNNNNKNNNNDDDETQQQ